MVVVMNPDEPDTRVVQVELAGILDAKGASNRCWPACCFVTVPRHWREPPG